MHKERRSVAWHKRALVTETLPYEVPVIFTNDRFFYLVTREDEDEDTQKAISKILQSPKNYSIPYQYQIRKDSTRTTELSIIHPLWQLEICNFYAAHEGSLLSFCAKSEYSLRRPNAIASMYSDKEIPNNAVSPKQGIVEKEDADDEISPSHFVSYFTYAKYNLLSKFYESREFLRLEKRFRFMRTLDISKCFYHIYTHSVSWAIKDKKFAKLHSNSYSFEGRFDRLMQTVNYNETNGIVVGPELSRIFAEIILQEVDLSIQRELAQRMLVEGRDYSIRRYVDDYAIFASGNDLLDYIQKVVAEKLGAVKLYLNEKKIQTHERPFVTPLTLARSELGERLKSLEDFLAVEEKLSPTRLNKLRGILKEVRSVAAKHGIDIGSVSGWVISTLRRAAFRNNAEFTSNVTADAADKWSKITEVILDLTFHLCALDLRVRTTYSACQLIKAIFSMSEKLPDDHLDQIRHLVADELSLLVTTFGKNGEVGDAVEYFNVLICGAHFLRQEFTTSNTVEIALKRLATEDLTYFKYITLKFCYLSDADHFKKELLDLCDRAKLMLLAGDPKQDSQLFLMLCDFLSSPAVQGKDKLSVYKHVFGGTISLATMERVAKRVGFVDWDGLNVDHILRRKELRPVYAVA
ncbi:antiviral reverse transcriptase Drt3b [Cupriavidus metallidurans]|uniref:antiviral reverse transcriptase Drt3b n=1 Tax=Cupriavidus metallidurans TaxID=119219 RepID=UPI003CFBDF0A